MTERPIIFSGPMVRAVLEGRKTQTRRVVRWPVMSASDGNKRRVFGPDDVEEINRLLAQKGRTALQRIAAPYGCPGDRAWVRETFAKDVPGCEFQGGYSYRADHLDPKGDGPDAPLKWTPSIYMPRAASRVDLDVKAVRIESLTAISAEDAIAEGIERHDDDGVTYCGPFGSGHCDPRVEFARLWNSINGKRPGCEWVSDPWVWVNTFAKRPS